MKGYNTIILLHGMEMLTPIEYKKFQKGDTIFGADSNAEEVKRWEIESEQEAKNELAKYRCKYSCSTNYYIDEYALEYCDTDDEGKFISGSSYELAEEEIKD